jgi:ribosomal-protein-alanine N-acetyltransferase
MSLLRVFDIAAANKELVNFENLSVGHATPQDLVQISAIENQTSDYPCSDKQLQGCIDKTFVLYKDHLVVGFAVIMMVENQAELHNIAIGSKHQGEGVGSLFLNAIVAGLPGTIDQFYLEVRVSNYRAIRLYQRMGFIKIAERRDYYRNGLTREDAIVMARTCGK